MTILPHNIQWYKNSILIHVCFTYCLKKVTFLPSTDAIFDMTSNCMLSVIFLSKLSK